MPSGPFSAITWQNGVTATNQTNMQRYDDWIKQFEGTAYSVSASGSTTGTATLYQVLRGTIKMAIIVLTNFKNGSAGDVNLALPTPFTSHCMFWSGDSGPFNLKSSSTPQTIWTQLSFASGAGSAGGSNSATNANSNCNGHCDSAFDTIGLWGSQAQTFGGSIILAGV
jgi:hypothetical protein